MSLPTNLTTNEVKNAAGVEIEFNRLGALSSNPRSLEFAYASEQPARPFRMAWAHQELGTERARIRQSVQKTNYTVPTTNLVDTTRSTTVTVQTKVTVPIGNLTSLADVKDAVAAHVSALASRGADSTILFNCTGVGAEALVNGSL